MLARDANFGYLGYHKPAKEQIWPKHLTDIDKIYSMSTC